jgi:hypothetical protein
LGIIVNWYTKRRREKRDKQILALSVRVEGLTTEIELIEYDMFEEEYDELLRKRAYAAWKRSDLIMENFKEDQQ